MNKHIYIEDEIRDLIFTIKTAKGIPAKKLLQDRLDYLRNFIPTDDDPCPIGYYWDDEQKRCIFDVG